MHNTHEGYLNIPDFPAAAGNVYLLPDLQLSLLSIGQLCNAGCAAQFQKETVTISFNNKALLHVQRNPTTGMWHVESDQTAPDTPTP
jgi:hypothetical protein